MFDYSNTLMKLFVRYNDYNVINIRRQSHGNEFGIFIILSSTMTFCKLCGSRQTRNRPLDNTNVCNSCKGINENYSTNDEEMTFIDSSGKNYILDINSEINIIHSDDSQIMDNDYIPINSMDFKDNLLASLYTQVEFLKNQIMEKDLLIKSLTQLNSDYNHRDDFLRNQIIEKDEIIHSLIKQNSVHNYRAVRYIDTSDDSSSDGELSGDERSQCSDNGLTTLVNDDGDVDDWNMYFKDLHTQFQQFQQSTKTRLDQQIVELRQKKHQLQGLK